jgi:benzodiazapine receptor
VRDLPNGSEIRPVALTTEAGECGGGYVNTKNEARMTRRQNGNPWIALVVSILIVAAVAFVGSRFVPGPWYEALAKPSWNPPDWVFGPAWTVLYALMALAAWKVWIVTRRIDAALLVYGAQLVLNAAWSYLFFGLQRPDLALVDIAALWLMILVTIILFWRRDRLAGSLLVPYLVWVTFASSLNFMIWRLNG